MKTRISLRHDDTTFSHVRLLLRHLYIFYLTVWFCGVGLSNPRQHSYLSTDCGCRLQLSGHRTVSTAACIFLTSRNC